MARRDSAYLLDTNVVRAILDGDSLVAQRTLATTPEKLFLSAVAVEEMTRGRLAELNDAREGKSRVGITLAYEWFLETLHLVHRFQILNYTDEDEAQYKQFSAAIKRIVGGKTAALPRKLSTMTLLLLPETSFTFPRYPDCSAKIGRWFMTKSRVGHRQTCGPMTTSPLLHKSVKLSANRKQTIGSFCHVCTAA